MLFIAQKFLPTTVLMGVYSHGVNRFATFIKMVDDGYVKPNNH